MKFRWVKNNTGVAGTEAEDPLKRACHEFERDDLYEPLSWVVSLRPRWIDENLQSFLDAKRYVIAANAMLYELKNQKAEEYLQQAMISVDPDSVRYRRVSVVLANLDVVSKIARRTWELDGKFLPAGGLKKQNTISPQWTSVS